MATEFIFSIEDRPGSLAQLSETLGNSGVNIDGIAGISAGGKGLIYLVTNDDGSCASALDSAGISYNKTEVLLLGLQDVPGAIAKIARPLADAGVNLTTFYVTMSGKQVLGADNIEKAREIASSLGVLVS